MSDVSSGESWSVAGLELSEANLQRAIHRMLVRHIVGLSSRILENAIPDRLECQIETPRFLGVLEGIDPA